ncbi:MBOAT family protein [Bacillus sp. RG28]|uniref:MBOAT family protein n=1 Tax=Gottfriedia endophytica TaxID=2820819 RepID=A0A940NLD1_9BACI|nr:MBOAT family protein [Gottfriedia endophytica]MBP0726357.1 MBOAT family protein [Gottfriedia endophytica]
MLFTSYPFLVFIVLLFLVYYLIPKKYQWILLLGASYLFYGFAGLHFLFFIIVTTISTYLVSKKIGQLELSKLDYLRQRKNELSKIEIKEYKTLIKSKKWKWLLLCLFINLGILAVMKYTNFTIANINYIARAFGSEGQLSYWTIAVPLGISYYTFQSVGYIIDVYRGKYSPEKNPFKLALFVSFFPQLIQGPISRFDDLSKTLFQEHSFDKRNVKFGLQRIMWGFFKKLVIADQLSVAVNTIFNDPGTYQGAYVFVGMLFYAFQLYADFTGGIDITIGIAQVLGITVKENFHRPYFSKSIAEYWRRWHISMGTWFKDYVFYPLSVSHPMLKLNRFSRSKFGDEIGKRVPVYISVLTLWFTTGIWHGASWNFIVWGLTNGVVILISQEFHPFYNWFHTKFKVKHTFYFRLFQVVRTILLMSSIRLFDCYEDVPLTFKMFGTMFTSSNYFELFNGALLKLGLSIDNYIVLFFGLLTILTVSLIQRTGNVRIKLEGKPIFVRYAVYYILIISIIVLGAYGIGYESSQFIYNRF